MLVFVLRRLVAAVVLAFVVASAALLLAAAAPGDSVAAALGIGARQETVERLRRERGLDRSAAEIYARWLAGVARLDFGTSFVYRRPVGPLVAERARNTALLGVAAFALALGIGLPLGVFSGSRRGAAAALVRGTSILLLSLPPLLASLLLVWMAAVTGVAPVSGMTALDPGAPWIARAADLARHLIVPALALALPLAAALERVQSQAVAEALEDPSILAALARGVSRRRALWVHAARLAGKPVAAVSGLMVGALLSGSFAVEIITSWPGLGRLTYDALVARDIYLAAGCATAAAVLLAIGIVGSDVALAYLDPRLRTGAARVEAAAR
jgi:peptide/nickel transport system permease protein